MECNVCTQSKQLEEMHPDGRKSSGFRTDLCEACYQQGVRERHMLDKRRYRADPDKMTAEKYRSWQLKKNYGLTIEEFDERLRQQDGKCAACRSDNPRWSKGWCVDHDHACCLKTPTCGSCVRGILCMPCNMAAGVMKDSVDDLLALVDYLKGPGYVPPRIAEVLGL